MGVPALAACRIAIRWLGDAVETTRYTEARKTLIPCCSLLQTFDKHAELVYHCDGSAEVQVGEVGWLLLQECRGGTPHRSGVGSAGL